MTILFHHLPVHSPIPLFDPLGLPHIPAIDFILEVEFARMLAEIRIDVAKLVCGLEVHAALLLLLLLPLVQLHLGHHVAVLGQYLAQGVIIVKVVIVFRADKTR